MIHLLIALTLSGRPGPTPLSKPPWAWTTEERIAQRVDPVARQARRARELPKARRVAPGWTPIIGSVEPELFLPVELVASLARDTLDAGHAQARERYRAAIQQAGWSFDHFWEILGTAGAPYMSLMDQAGKLQRDSHGHADTTQ